MVVSSVKTVILAISCFSLYLGNIFCIVLREKVQELSPPMVEGYSFDAGLPNVGHIK